MERKKNSKPLLYIAQPDFGESDQQSADYVKSPVVNTAVLNEQDANDQKEISNVEEIKSEQVSEQVSEKSNPKKRKKFQEMSITEKVDFIINLPHQLPRLTAEIVTEDGSYRGLIYEENNGVISIRTYQPPYKEDIELAKVTAINIVSL